MRTTKIVFGLAMLSLLLGNLSALAVNDYRTISSGAWTTVANWERYDGSNWVAATSTPANTTANVVTVRNGHTMTVTAALSVDQTIVDSGGQILVTASTLTINGTAADPDMVVYGKIGCSGTGAVASGNASRLVIENGGVYEHGRNGGTYPTATWNTGSTLLITGLTATDAGGDTQNFHNITWNCAGQTSTINTTNTGYRNIAGTLKVISTGATSSWQWTASSSNTKNIGNYEQTGGSVLMSGAGGSKEVYLTGDFKMTGGTLTETGSATNCGWNFQKGGTALFDKTGGTISETIYFNVVSGTTLDIVQDPITGKGAFTLNSGAGLIIHNASGITSSGASGAVQVTGTRTYSTGANYTYDGSAGQAAGNGLPATVNSLTISTPGGISGSVPTTLDAYTATGYTYLGIAGNGVTVSSFSASTTGTATMPARINRAWTISGTFTGSKSVTFYWNAADDNNFIWGAVVPAVYKGLTKYTQTAYNVTSNPRFVTVTLPNFAAKGTYTVGGFNDETLPVELSSFTAVLTADFFVKLHWVTQSETGVSGFYVYRGTNS